MAMAGNLEEAIRIDVEDCGKEGRTLDESAAMDTFLESDAGHLRNALNIVGVVRRKRFLLVTAMGGAQES